MVKIKNFICGLNHELYYFNIEQHVFDFVIINFEITKIN